jgi:crotonobetainyl-CoA:carnitine CoA-transferase CaiB-like acyl-CoA transferase
MLNELPLSDIKVLDLMWVMAGPASTRVLADYGAQVVRVESTRRFDTARTIGPFHKNTVAPESSGLFLNMNAGKLGITIDPGNPEGRSIILDLVKWADVVTESFSPRAMRNWGLDYETLRKIKPEIVMLSSCLMGQTGPLASFAGYGNLAAAISGFFNLGGWSDRAPCGPFGAYTDYVSPRFTAAALLAALEWRDRTGEGQYIDLSQAEASLSFLGPALLDYTANGRVAERAGNRDREVAPHGIYPCAGDDRWIAIVCRDDREWKALSESMERPDLAADRRFSSPATRSEHQAELDVLISYWTGCFEPLVLEHRLQHQGIAAHQVQNSAEAIADPQLIHRGHFVALEHSTLGPIIVEGSRFKLSRTPARVNRAAPTVGQDTHDVLEQILGYSEERITELVAAGALD